MESTNPKLRQTTSDNNTMNTEPGLASVFFCLHVQSPGPVIVAVIPLNAWSHHQPFMIHAEILDLASNDHLDWSDFAEYEPTDPFDDFGWFHITVGGTGIEGGNDFQVCVSTRRAVGRVRRSGAVPGVIVDCFDAESVDTAIRARISSIVADSWEQIVNECRTFMLWEYEDYH